MSTSFPQLADSGGGPVELFDAKTLFTPAAGFSTDDDYVASYFTGDEVVIYLDIYRTASVALADTDNFLLGTFDATLRPTNPVAQVTADVIIGGNRIPVTYNFNALNGQLRARPAYSHAAAAGADFEVYGLRALVAEVA